MNRKFNPPGFPAPPFYSQACEAKAVERTLYISGQVGVGPDGALAADVESQTRAAANSLLAVLAAGDMGLADVVKFTFYLTDEQHMDAFQRGAAGLIASPPAPATLVFVKALAAPQMFVEIEAIAAK